MIVLLNAKIFGKNLVYLRKKYALSRRALAKLIGIGENTLRGIEDQTSSPELRLEVFQRLREVFHVDANDLAQIDLSALDK